MLTVDGAVDRVAAEWRGAPRVTVVPTVEALPFRAPADAEGVYRRGEVHLVRDAMEPARAVKVLSHEVVGHHGIRKALGSAWPSFMVDVLTGARSDPALRAARTHVERTYTGPDGRCNLPALHLADEVAASLAEHAMDTATGRIAIRQPLRKQAMAMRGHLAREVLLLDHPVCRAQLEGVVLMAERCVRFGGRFFGVPMRLLGWYAGTVTPPKPRPLHPYKPPMSFEESKALLAAEDGRRQRKEDDKVLGQMSLVALLAVATLCTFAYGAYVLASKAFG